MDQNSKSPREPPKPPSRMSLRVKSEHTDIREEGNLTVESSVEIDVGSGHRIEISCEGGAAVGTSQHLSQVSVLYTKINYETYCISSDSVLRKEWTKGEESQTTVQLEVGEDDGRVGELVNITPPAFPPIVLYGAPPLQGAPPTYSAVMRIGPVEVQPRRSFRLFGRRPEIQPSAPFIAPLPPPTYAEAHGFHVAAAFMPGAQFEAQETSGTDPLAIICPFCNHYVITRTLVRCSAQTHFSAIILCLCGCWLCCFMPYCMKSCKTTYHECPLCSNTIGTQNPW